MQAQSRLGARGGGGGGSSSSSASEDEHEAVIRELTRGHELTARLRAEALRALRGQGQAEATAAFILQEVSRAFTVCLSIMSSPARAPPPPPETPALAAAAAPPPPPPPRRRDDSIPREQRVTSSPHYDGYQWRKYGQKRITRTHFPRCYYRCSFHRERSCRATKQVQQCSGGEPPQYLVMYFNEHTCDTAAWTPADAATSSAAMLDLSPPSSAGLQAAAAAGLDERGVQEERERQVLVSSLARVLSGQQLSHHHQQSPPAAVAVGNVAREPPPAPGPASAGEMPRLDVDVLGLDVMDFDVTGPLPFGDSYGLPLPDGAF